MLKSLYVRRDLINKAEFSDWAKSQGFDSVVDDPHVTVLYSKKPVDWEKMKSSANLDFTVIGGTRKIEPLGDKGAIVLHFKSPSLKRRHDHMVEMGASHDYPNYQCHVTISYNAPTVDISNIKIFESDLLFGPEIFEEIKEDFQPKES